MNNRQSNTGAGWEPAPFYFKIMKKTHYMRGILFPLLCMLFCSIKSTIAQERYDCRWDVGYGRIGDSKSYCGHLLLFDPDTLQNVSDSNTIFIHHFENSITYNDPISGEVLFHTNGHKMYNRRYDVMFGGGSLIDYSDPYDMGMRFWAGILVLPRPGSTTDYQYIADANPYVVSRIGDVYHAGIYAGKVDMTANSGLGRVYDRTLIVSDSTSLGNIIATRHANGRDWWIVKPYRLLEGTYFRWLYTPVGLERQADLRMLPYHHTWQSAFRPDGSAFALATGYGSGSQDLEVHLMDFDRCSGTFSNERVIDATPWRDQDTVRTGGICFSPSGQYLYVMGYDTVYQYDTWAPDIPSTRTIILAYDGWLHLGFFPAHFYLAGLAPNGKIYITTNSSTPALTVINQPDLPGILCDAVQRGQPHYQPNCSTIPNHPNYLLGPLHGSPCDTLTAVREPTAADYAVDIGPIPTDRYLRVTERQASGKSYTLHVRDIQGRELLRMERPLHHTLDIAELPEGM